MATKRQLEANRANAKRSTGPKTLIGKARARMNAVKHGLTANNLIGDEDPKDFEKLRADIEADFQPQTRLEHELVDHLVNSLWRQRRVLGLEAALVKARQAAAQVDAETERESAFHDRIEQEARRRFNETFENDEEAISRAMFDGTYAAVIPDIRDEVEAEWRADARQASDQDPNTTEAEDGKMALLKLIQDVENSDALGKLNRYETNLMNSVARTLQQLHVLRSLRGATKLISGSR
jgi:hypothetical protein